MYEGLDHHDAQELDAAETAMRDAIRLDETLAEARLSLARIQLQRHLYLDAKDNLLEAVERQDLAPAMRVDLGYALGRALTGLGHDATLTTEQRRDALRAAAVAFAEVTEIDPKHYRAHYRRAAALDELDQPAPADAAYRECIAIEPRYSPCWASLGLLVLDHGFRANGLAVLQTGTEVNPTDAVLWSALGRGHLSTGDPQSAILALEKASSLDPQLVDVLFGLGQAYAALGQTTAAIDRLSLFLTRAGDDVPEPTKRAANDLLARLRDPM